jgi:hypothetical protein
MTIKNPYQPPSYGVTHLSVDRTAAGEPPAPEILPVGDGEKAEAEPKYKAARKPANKAARKPANKAAK